MAAGADRQELCHPLQHREDQDLPPRKRHASRTSRQIGVLSNRRRWDFPQTIRSASRLPTHPEGHPVDPSGGAAIMGGILSDGLLLWAQKRPLTGTKEERMYKCLSPSAIGVIGRQSELVEIALTHRFKGLEIDITELTKRAQTTGVPQACRYLSSAHMAIGGFELPVRWAGEEQEFAADLAQLPLLLEVASTLHADRCFTSIRPTCDQRPFHENFKFHTERLQKLADALAPGNVKLGLVLLAAPADRADGGFEFIHQVEPLLTLLNSVQRENVGLVLDTWSWFVGGGDLEKVRTLKAEQILSVRLADLPADADLAAITSQQRLMPGEGGAIDCAALLGILEELGYDGPVTVAPDPESSKGQTREATITRASTALDGLLAGVSGETAVATAEKS
ncbi:MAG TPA: TIM barrel protein [Pirellulaceae bacterium]|nr:TIM barrel protein [Pirellulaceae bacterium]